MVVLEGPRFVCVDIGRDFVLVDKELLWVLVARDVSIQRGQVLVYQIVEGLSLFFPVVFEMVTLLNCFLVEDIEFHQAREGLVEIVDVFCGFARDF